MPTTHTPGPWIVSPTKHRTLIVSELGFHVAATEEVSDLDARLIASAPDLLAALQALIEEYEPNLKAFALNAPRRAKWERARAAIARATAKLRIFKMNEIEYERMQEIAAEGEHANACLDAILSDNGSEPTLPALYRSIYKYTECGPWLSVQTWDGRTFHCSDLHKVDKNEVRYLLVGSIVESSDAEVFADPIDLVECESPEDAVKRFNDALEWVNAEACALWDEANDDDTDEGDAA